MYMYVSRVSWEVQSKHRTTLWQNEAHPPQKVSLCNRGVTKMIFVFYTFELFAFKLKRQRESVTVQLPFSSFFKVFFWPFLVSPWSLLWAAEEAQHHLVSSSLSCLSSFFFLLLSQSSPGWKQVYIELTGRALLVEQGSVAGSVFNRFLVALEGSAAPIICVSSSQKFLIVQEFGVLARLPEPVEAEVEVLLNHLFALVGRWDRRKGSITH